MRRNILFLFFYLSFAPLGSSPYLVEEGQIGQVLPTYPCADLALDAEGLTCQVADPFGERSLFLPFPRLFISDTNVASLRSLPVSSVSERVRSLRIWREEQLEPLELQEVHIRLSFVPAISNTLIPYLEGQWTSWGKDRVPYVGEWEVSYLMLIGETWVPQHFSGKISPADIPNLPPDLAADINYNGIPTAFWNTQVSQP